MNALQRGLALRGANCVCWILVGPYRLHLAYSQMHPILDWVLFLCTCPCVPPWLLCAPNPFSSLPSLTLSGWLQPSGELVVLGVCRTCITSHREVCV